MTAEIPSWMNPAQKGQGLGELDADHRTQTPQSDMKKANTPAMRDARQNNQTASFDEIEYAELVDTMPELPESGSTQDLLDPSDAEILAQVMPKLRGVRSVTIRVFGENNHAGPALLEQLRLRGLDVKLSGITQIVPPPISKISVRYQGVDATITLAPDID
jgi:hypothetical protein